MLPEARCGTCRWWVSPEDDYNPHNVHDSEGWGTCDLSETSYDEKVGPERSHRLMAAQDGSGYWAALLTSPDFGCVQHANKETDA